MHKIRLFVTQRGALRSHRGSQKRIQPLVGIPFRVPFFIINQVINLPDGRQAIRQSAINDDCLHTTSFYSSKKRAEKKSRRNAPAFKVLLSLAALRTYDDQAFAFFELISGRAPAQAI